MSSKCSVNIADNAAVTNPTSTGQESYGFKYGSDPMSNSHGAIQNFDNQTLKLVKHHRAHHGGSAPLTTGDQMAVPQFNCFNCAGPADGTSASAHNNLVKLTGNRQSLNDNYAFCDTEGSPPSKGVGGGKRSRRRRRKSRSKKRRITKVKKVRKYKRTKRRKSRKGRKGRRSTIKVIRNLKW